LVPGERLRYSTRQLVVFLILLLSRLLWQCLLLPPSLCVGGLASPHLGAGWAVRCRVLLASLLLGVGYRQPPLYSGPVWHFVFPLGFQVGWAACPPAGGEPRYQRPRWLSLGPIKNEYREAAPRLRHVGVLRTRTGAGRWNAWCR
jgi:hypothetical protein